MPPEYFTYKTDEEIDKMIDSLSLYQKSKFDQAVKNYGDKRHALFIARSFPPKEREE